jgi:hypothetical protein
MEGEIAVLSANLVGIKKLKMLHFKHECAVYFKAFGPLLSDPSSLENICNSNHTLEKLRLLTACLYCKLLEAE